MNPGIQYYLGLVDVKMDDNTPDQMNRAWFFNAGIPIGKATVKKRLSRN
jgi:hypothetical protein